MEVFKVYSKIFRKKISVIIIYTLIFLGVIFMLSQDSTNSTKVFTDTKIRTTFINNDTDSVLVQGFYEFLTNYCEFIEIPEDEIDDALFVREIEYVIEVENGFEEALLNGESVTIKKQSIPDSFQSTATNAHINNYLNAAKVLYDHSETKDVEELVVLLNDIMTAEGEARIFGAEEISNANTYYEVYFNYLSFITIACFILIIGIIMHTFQSKEIRKRNLVAPISIMKLNLKLFCSNLVFVLGFFAIFFIFCIVTSEDAKLNIHLLLYGINSLAFSFVALAISYLIGYIIKNTTTITLISMTVSIVFAFLGGVFVPLEMFDEGVIKISQFFPSYWHVVGNDIISQLSVFDFANLLPLIKCIGIQLGFASLMLIIANVWTYKKRTNEA